MIWWVFLIKTGFCFWLSWLFPPGSPLRTDSSIPFPFSVAAPGLKLVTAVSVLSPEWAGCLSDRGRAGSNAIIPIIINLSSHQSLWRPCRPPASAPVWKGKFVDKSNFYIYCLSFPAVIKCNICNNRLLSYGQYLIKHYSKG